MSVVTLSNLSVEKPRTRKLDQRTSNNNKTMLLNDISCEVNAGEILAVIGPNGAGKSTLIKAIAGDIAYSGNADIAGLSQHPTERARQLAILPQLSLLNFPYRVHEVVNLARIPHKTGNKVDNQIIDEALSMMDISFLKHRLYTELSGGEKQRVQLARVLAQIWNHDDAESGTRVLLLDEPTTALDLGHQKELMNVIRTFSKQGVAVMMVLHDLNLAIRYADKLLALLCSEVIAYGTANEVITKANIQRLFNIDADIINHPESGIPVVLNT